MDQVIISGANAASSGVSTSTPNLRSSLTVFLNCTMCPPGISVGFIRTATRTTGFLHGFVKIARQGIARGEGPALSARSDSFSRVALTELRVLLLSPLPELDPPGGDVTYTQELLKSPPPGVVYETYAQALAGGSLVELGRRNSLNGVLKRELPISLAMIGREHAVNALRSRELLFREPFRYFDIKSPGYVLVHDRCTAFPFGVRCHLCSSPTAPHSRTTTTMDVIGHEEEGRWHLIEGWRSAPRHPQLVGAHQGRPLSVL